MKDDIYSREDSTPGSFKFDDKVATVFEDMLDRSIPCYREVLRMTAELLASCLPDGRPIYDLGCSTGTLEVAIRQVLPEVPIIAVDKSSDMTARAADKLKKLHLDKNIELVCTDLLDFTPGADAGAVVMNYTLQFIPQKQRLDLLKKVCSSLTTGGFLIISEKLKPEVNAFQSHQLKAYDDFKRRNGYSNMEIAAKKEALENVLFQSSLPELQKLLAESGFQQQEIFFKWHFFTSLMVFRDE